MAQQGEILRQLAMEEFGRIFTLDADDSQVLQARDAFQLFGMDVGRDAGRLCGGNGGAVHVEERWTVSLIIGCLYFHRGA